MVNIMTESSKSNSRVLSPVNNFYVSKPTLHASKKQDATNDRRDNYLMTEELQNTLSPFESTKVLSSQFDMHATKYNHNNIANPKLRKSTNISPSEPLSKKNAMRWSMPGISMKQQLE